MQRLWIRWTVLIVFVIALGVAFVNLGSWQLDRLAQRKERNTVTVTNEQRPIRPFDEIFTKPITDADQWQQVTATGTFDADHQFVLRYRKAGDIDGYEVVTPLRTDSGVLLVDRGLLPVGRGVKIPETAPPPPVGEVSVTGHVRRNENGRSGAVQPVNQQMRLINSDAIGAVLPYPIVNGYLGLLSVTPEQEGDFHPIPLPEISEGPHFWYAVQWFMFTGIGFAGIVVFIRGDVRARRAGEAAGTAKPKAPTTGAGVG